MPELDVRDRAAAERAPVTDDGVAPVAPATACAAAHRRPRPERGAGAPRRARSLRCAAEPRGGDAPRWGGRGAGVRPLSVRPASADPEMPRRPDAAVDYGVSAPSGTAGRDTARPGAAGECRVPGVAPVGGRLSPLSRPAGAPGCGRVSAAPRTVRPTQRRCLGPARRPMGRVRRAARSGRADRMLVGLATALCAATVVVVLGFLGDAAAGWNAPSGAEGSVVPSAVAVEVAQPAHP